MEKKGSIARKRGHRTAPKMEASIAIDIVRSKKMSVRQASEAYSIPKSSLHAGLVKLNKGKM
jgi:hypothetical protein